MRRASDMFAMPRSLAAKLYGIAALVVILVASVAGASVHFAERTGRAATQLHTYAVTGVVAASEIGILLERHRRIVEGALARSGHEPIDRDVRRSEDVAAAIAGLAQGAKDPLLASIASGIPSLIAHGRLVLELGADSSPQTAKNAAAEYTAIANRLQDQIVIHRDDRLSRADADVTYLVDNSRALVTWSMASGLIAVLLIGPLSLVIVRGIIARMKEITEAMRKLAANDTSVRVPYSADADEIGEMARAVAVFKANAIALKQHQSHVEKLNAWFDIALNNMARGLSMFSPGERLLVCNRRYAEMYDLPAHLTLPGTPFAAIIEYSSRAAAGRMNAEDAGSIEPWLAGHRRTAAMRAKFSETHRLTDGRVFMINCQPLEGGGWVDLHEEVTEKLRSEEKISELARFDTLTSLANRHHFLEQLESCFARAADGMGFAILWIDLDHFKEVNDTFGHPAGDALLCIIAERLRSAVRETDFVARLGGDEFVVIMRGMTTSAAAAASLAARIEKVVSRPCDVAGHPVTVGASIGIALAPESGATPGDLMKNADIALYRAKSDGRGGHVFFCSELEQKLHERRRLEIDLRGASAAGQLELHYQPIFDLGRRQVTACEALMRWTHPDLGAISPAVFIPLAEETGLIGPLGEWAIRQACQDAVRWPDHVSVAVNLSAAQFTSSNILAVADEALRASGLSARRLEFEVTETLLLKDEPKTRETLHDLRLLGISIALDDFGTGYSSLSYLRSFPFDTIKIDQTFVRDLPDHRDSVAIVRAIADLAKTLGMRTIAEGVETLAHLEKVEAAGCDEAQGYYFSRPVPAGRILEVIEGCRVKVAA